MEKENLNSDHVQSLTFFDPLKEDNSLTRSGLLQSVLGFFNAKKETNPSSISKSEVQRSVQNRSEDIVLKYQPEPKQRLANNSSETPQMTQSRSLSTHSLNDAMLSRPQSLGIRPVYKSKRIRQGYEVEVHLRNFSTMFKDFPRMIARNNPNIKELAQGLQTQSEEADIRQYWMPDKDCHECYECGDRFTTFRRRHHCRICGHIFCSRCCFQLISGHLIGYVGMVRSCTYCYTSLMSCTKSTGNLRSSMSVTEQDAVMEVNQDTSAFVGSAPLDQVNSSLLKQHGRAGRSRSLISMRGSPVDDQPPTLSITSPSPYDTANWTSAYDVFDATPNFLQGLDSAYENEQMILAKGSNQLHDLWMKITDDKDGAEFRDHRFRLRKFTQSITGTELVDWLLSRGIAATRDQACVIGQALLDAEWIKSVNEERDKIFHDEYCLYQHGNSANKDVHRPMSGKKSGFEASQKSCRTRLLFDQTGMTDSEPNWVREIAVDEDDNDLTLVNDEDDVMFWAPAQSMAQPFHPAPHFSDEDSSSPRSIISVSSFVEIDNERDIIKYKRPCTRDISETRKANAGLKQPQFVDDSLTEISADYIRGFLAWNGTYLNNSLISCNVGWRETDLYQPSISSHAKQAFYKLQKLYFQHSMCFLRQLFHLEQLDVSWADIIVPLAKRICESVIPNCEVNMDIAHYIHVKKSLDAPSQESRLVHGVVFTNNVINSRMRTRIDNPVIMLLATPLEYQRIHYKLSSLDPIVRQEPEFFKHLVSRIVTRQPDVIISQCSVSHEARRLLLDAGISLVINVKQSVMERLSRCTGADIARSIDQLQNVRLGTCGRFRVHRHYNGKRKFRCSDGILSHPSKSAHTNAYKMVVYLDGCNLVHGCTVMLRDAPDYSCHCDADSRTRNCLSRVKSVFLFFIRIMYHCKLELSYLMDQHDLSASLLVSSAKSKTKEQRHQEKEANANDMRPTDALISAVSSNDTVMQNDASDTMETRSHSNTFSSVVSESNTITQDHFDDEENISISSYQSPNIKVAAETVNLKQIMACLPCSEKLSSKSQIFIDKFSSTLLSISPMISPDVPFLLTHAGEASPLRDYLPETLFWSNLFVDEDYSDTSTECRRGHKLNRPHSEHLDSEYDKETLSFHSRSGTFDSCSIPQATWRSPPHHSGDTPVSNSSNFDDTATTLKSEMPSSKDAKQDNTSMKVPHGKHESVGSFHSSGYRRLASQASVKSFASADEYFLSSIEKSTMHKVLDLSGDMTSKPTSSPNTRNVESSGNARMATTSCRYPSQTSSRFKFDGTEDEEEKVVWKDDKHEFLTSSLSKPANSKTMRDMLADFRASGSSLRTVKPVRRFSATIPHSMKVEMPEILLDEEDIDIDPIDCLAPQYHQHIFVLFSSYSLQSPNSPYPCVMPWAVDIDYYCGNDITLGGFLERYCFRPSYHCPSPTCKRPMVEHVRSFVHGNTCMNIVLKELSKPVAIPNILSWCWNPETKASTDLKALSDDAWSMSFAKFLELRLQTFTQRSKTYPELSEDSVEVPPFKHFQYFLFRDIVASFKCYEIGVYEVAMPSQIISFKETTDWRKKVAVSPEDENIAESPSEYKQFVQSMNMLSKIGYEAMDSICDMIVVTRSNNQFDQLSGPDQPDLPEDVATLGTMREAHFDELMAVFQEERCQLRESVDGIHLKLQTLRINQITVRGDIENDEPSENSPLSVKMCASNEEQDTLPNVDTSCDSNNVKKSIVIDDAIRDELSLSLLQLTSLVSRLVHTWNARISAVVEQDRNSRKGSKLGGAPFYSDPPLPLYTASLDSKTANTKQKIQPSLKTVQEDNESMPDMDVDKVDSLSEDNDEKQMITTEMHDRTSNNPTAPEDKNANEDFLDSDNYKSNDANEKKVDIPSNSPLSIPQRHHERQLSIGSVKRFSRNASSLSMKSFVNQLLSSTNHMQVPPPFPLDEHYLLPNCIASQVVVRDMEPGSIIAYTLHTPAYVKYMCGECSVSPAKSPVKETTNEIQANMKDKSELESTVSISTSLEKNDLPRVEFHGIEKRKPAPSRVASLSVPKPPHANTSSPAPSPPPTPKTRSPHIEVQFGDSTTIFYCKVYFAAGFKSLREQILEGPDEAYISSLSRCVRWAARGGKSGSAFHKTLDDRLVLKQMSRFELQSFLEVAQNYLRYVTEAVHKKLPTALSKIVGVYRVSFRNSSTNRTFKQDLLVMENLFYKRNIQQVFDLKGSVRNRHVKTDSESSTSYTSSSNNQPSSTTSSISGDALVTNRNDLVLLDENLLSIMRDRPLYVHEHTKILIKKALSADAQFLSRHLIIDYSLLVGIDVDKKEIVVGIIDYMRTFTWDKKLEMVVKSYGMIGRQGTRSMPTVVSPELYRNRFCDAMDRYFQVVPDRWYRMQAYDSDRQL